MYTEHRFTAAKLLSPEVRAGGARLSRQGEDLFASGRLLTGINSRPEVSESVVYSRVLHRHVSSFAFTALLGLALLPELSAAETVATMRNSAGGNIVLTSVSGRCPMFLGTAFIERRSPAEDDMLGCWIARGGAVIVEWPVLGIMRYERQKFTIARSYRAQHAIQPAQIVGIHDLMGTIPPAATLSEPSPLPGSQVATSRSTTGAKWTFRDAQGACPEGLLMFARTSPGEQRRTGCWRSTDNIGTAGDRVLWLHDDNEAKGRYGAPPSLSDDADFVAAGGPSLTKGGFR